MSISQICIIIAIIAYISIMVYVGISYSKTNTSIDAFYLGGRKLGPVVTAMSAEASDMSSWLLMGLPGVAYLSGIAEAGWTAIGLALGTYVNWLIVSKRIRRYTSELHALTIPDFFSKRYGDDKNILTCVSAIIIIIFFIPYTASGFAACAKLFNTLFGLNYIAALILSAAIIVLYCTLGGFLAVSTTDLIQGVTMSIALIIVICFGVFSAGGFHQVIANAQALPGYLSMVKSYVPTTGSSTPYSALSIASLLAWGLGYFGMPHILLRFMAIENEEKLGLSRRIASIWVVISMAIAVFIGIIGYSMSKASVIPTLEGSNSETIIVQIASVLSQHNILTALLAGLILAGILAATMSTADSQLLAAASSISQNLLQDFGKKKIDTNTSVKIARITVIVISLISVVLASNPDSSVFEIVSFAWAGFGAAFGPIVLCALFWKRSNKWGALCGMITGGAMIFIWKYGIARLGGVFAIYELLPAFLLAMLVNVIVSLLTAAPSKEVLTVYDKVNNH
ncbi:MAG: sodium/proline symporter [Blautia sp.]|nr:sodium/proline symporter [Lachnoclostridium sp.]MCM1212236.1 sodium/proline symporter [Blautia sp.]